MKKLFATAILALVLAATCLADCPPPAPGQESAPPCTGSSYLADEASASTNVAMSAPIDEHPNEIVSFDLFIVDVATSSLLAIL